MDRLRTPFFILAIVLIFIAILIEIGTALPGVLRSSPTPLTAFQLPPQVAARVASLSPDQQNAVAQLSQQDRPPGFAIPSLALLDGIMLFTVSLMGVALLLSEHVQVRVQGIATFIFSLLLIIVAFLTIIAAFSLLTLMISLLLSVPFGTIVYLIVYGSFNRAGADIALSLLMLLKFGFSGSLIFAQQRFLSSKGLVLLILTSLLSNIIVTLLLGIVPGFLDSITDAIATIIVGIIAVIWGIFLLIGSIISILKLIRFDRALPAIPLAKK